MNAMKTTDYAVYCVKQVIIIAAPNGCQEDFEDLNSNSMKWRIHSGFSITFYERTSMEIFTF